jgi:hypothetical protein
MVAVMEWEVLGLLREVYEIDMEDTVFTGILLGT